MIGGLAGFGFAVFLSLLLLLLLLRFLLPERGGDIERERAFSIPTSELKPGCVASAYTGTAGRNKLAGPADCISGVSVT